MHKAITAAALLLGTLILTTPAAASGRTAPSLEGCVGPTVACRPPAPPPIFPFASQLALPGMALLVAPGGPYYTTYFYDAPRGARPPVSYDVHVFPSAADAQLSHRTLGIVDRYSVSSRLSADEVAGYFNTRKPHAEAVDELTYRNLVLTVTSPCRPAGPVARHEAMHRVLARVLARARAYRP